MSRRRKFLLRVGGQSGVGRTRATFARVTPFGGYDWIFIKAIFLRGPKCVMLKGLGNYGDQIFWLLVWFHEGQQICHTSACPSYEPNILFSSAHGAFMCAEFLSASQPEGSLVLWVQYAVLAHQ